MFTVRGFSALPNTIRGETGLTWNAGYVTGDDPGMVRAAYELAQARDGVAVGPPDGPVTLNNHFDSAISAAFLLREMFVYGSTTFSGDIPERAPLSAGAIG